MKIKYILIIILGIIFIVATIFSIVNASRLLGEGFKAALDYDECDTYPRLKPVSPDNETLELEEEYYCINNKKRNIAESLAYLIISLPIAILFYRKLMKTKE